jgi:hypothetical protein
MPTTPSAPVTDWGGAMMTSLTGALALFLAAIPKIVAFAVILILGWLAAGLVGRGLAALLRRMNFNSAADRMGLSRFVGNMGLRTDSAGAVAFAGKWFVRLIALVVAFDALGLPAVSRVMQQLLLWLPNLVVALVILVIAGLAANTVAGLARGTAATAGIRNADALATITRVAVWGFGIVVAVNQIGVAAIIVNTMFMGLIGSLALALGLAFGLGGRDTAAEMVRGWYGRSRRAGQAMVEGASRVAEEVEERPRRRPAA